MVKISKAKVELLYQIYVQCNESINAMERTIKEKKVHGLPISSESIKFLVDKYDFIGRFRKESEEKAKLLEKENKDFDEQLLKIVKAGIAKYAQGLPNKKWLSENGFKNLFEMYMTLTGRPSVYTKNENENVDVMEFINAVRDDTGESDQGNDQYGEVTEGLGIYAPPETD